LHDSMAEDGSIALKKYGWRKKAMLAN
jgi:hypothetical protein